MNGRLIAGGFLFVATFVMPGPQVLLALVGGYLLGSGYIQARDGS